MKERTSDVAKQGIWTVLSVSDQPVVRLSRWSVFEVEAGDRFLVGFNIDGQEGRVSTPIKSFDSLAGLAVTASGRVYELIGAAGHDPDGTWIWNSLMEMRKMKYRDVTEEYLVRMKDQEV